jgi:hypothetical protein
MPTQLDIANLALAHLNVGKPIGSLAEATQSARVMTQFYAQARNEVLRDFGWPFATKFVSLTLVAGPSPRASVDYAYSYRYPADGVTARRLRIQPRRPDVRLARVPFTVAQDGTGRLLLTDVPPIDATTDFPAFPQLEYTAAVDESLWPPDFVMAVSRLLAWYASPLITGGDPHKLGVRAFQEYDRTVRRAWQNNLSEREDDIDDPECSFLTARD